MFSHRLELLQSVHTMSGSRTPKASESAEVNRIIQEYLQHGRMARERTRLREQNILDVIGLVRNQNDQDEDLHEKSVQDASRSIIDSLVEAGILSRMSRRRGAERGQRGHESDQDGEDEERQEKVPAIDTERDQQGKTKRPRRQNGPITSSTTAAKHSNSGRPSQLSSDPGFVEHDGVDEHPDDEYVFPPDASPLTLYGRNPQLRRKTAKQLGSMALSSSDNEVESHSPPGSPCLMVTPAGSPGSQAQNSEGERDDASPALNAHLDESIIQDDDLVSNNRSDRVDTQTSVKSSPSENPPAGLHATCGHQSPLPATIDIPELQPSLDDERNDDIVRYLPGSKNVVRGYYRLNCTHCANFRPVERSNAVEEFAEHLRVDHNISFADKDRATVVRDHCGVFIPDELMGKLKRPDTRLTGPSKNDRQPEINPSAMRERPQTHDVRKNRQLQVSRPSHFQHGYENLGYQYNPSRPQTAASEISATVLSEARPVMQTHARPGNTVLGMMKDIPWLLQTQTSTVLPELPVTVSKQAPTPASNSNGAKRASSSPELSENNSSKRSRQSGSSKAREDVGLSKRAPLAKKQVEVPEGNENSADVRAKHPDEDIGGENHGEVEAGEIVEDPLNHG
ncbi:uncharacterized protein LY89DRAFT_387039 [Mollisia scopiformis]|uniref:Uncharacterized protein n=1 Tax=Mollisia scopiformis TaxID=149040 RepID=A0A194XP78_MOLSC|nr:uncharacterized protein LY89DRAFT_387039 [Mollisia scopiformis]KUJ21884.1 hypothetical protein LY89DRAFT_387039 [Mollisia scopiformis]